MAHRQIWLKVNAPVDEGVIDLIAALSAFPRLRTIESCEDIGDGARWVCFQYGDEDLERPWQQLAEFILGYFGPGLQQQVGDRADVSIRVTTSGLPRGELVVRCEAYPAAVKAIRKLRRDYHGRP